MIERQAGGYKLRVNHANSLPRYIVSVAVETRRIKHTGYPVVTADQFRCGYAISCRYRNNKTSAHSELSFRKREAFWTWLYAKAKIGHTTWVVGHNLLPQLRWLDLMAEMEQSRLVTDSPRRKRNSQGNPIDDTWSQGIICLNAPPTIIGLRCASTQGRIICVDLLNWFDASIQSIAAETKQFLIDDPLPDDEEHAWANYCASQAKIVLNTFTELMQWKQQNDLGMFRYTAASQAMSAYKHRFMLRPIYLHDNMQVKSLERAAYHGGRSEVFRLGRIAEAVYKLDANSLFPSVMRSVATPYILKRFHLSNAFSAVLPDIRWCDSVAAVAIVVSEAVYPTVRNGNVVYPIGAFQTTLCGSELERARNRGEILGVESWEEYDCAILFREYVDELWELRRRYKHSGNNLYEAFTKRLLNALYGKWGQRAFEWETVDGIYAPEAFASWSHLDTSTGVTRHYRSFGWTVQVESDKKEIASSFPAISAFITAAARCKMNALRKIAGKPNVYYQGVDSLIVTEAGRNNLQLAGEIMPNEIGKLRIDCSANYGHIYGAADYQIGDSIVIAGRCGRYDTLSETVFLQQKSHAKHGLFNGAPSPDTFERSEFWRRRREYAKGRVGRSGWVQPPEIAEPFELPADGSNALSTAN